jgi:type II secretory pathway pseudopilin PulG
MDASTTLIVVVVVLLLIVGAITSMVMSRRQRTKRLEERFGPEYDRAISEIGDQNQAEKELEERIAHVNALNIRSLSAEEVNSYALEWQATQREFVDEPLKALQKADRLIREVMKARGYPVEDFDQRIADISVNYPELVTDYRGLHRIAIKEMKDKVTTEDMRQAMVHGRALFENLMKQEPNEEQTNQKEKI